VFSRKTLELLLTNYININNGLRTPCAEKQKFEKLIKETEALLKSKPLDVIYPDGMTALEYAHKLAKEANDRMHMS
jgi:hypothetical protein|tara:strand:- start:658 stop:885 length:228 start_codon:yes stop_codon:yes gene_type:complete